MMLLSSAAGISISTKLDPNGNQQFIVNGNIRPNSTYTYQHLLYNPAYSIAGAFKNRLKAGGIAINGNIGILARNDTTNIKMTFLTDFKRPVFDLINIINKDSDNYLAEILFKMIGANFGANNDNAPKTRFLTDSLLKKLEIYSDGLILNDGSGLSRRNLVTVSSMVKLLENIYKSNFYDEFKNSLAIAGVDGTLKKRFHNTLAMSNLFAKTGTLRDVSALAGYVKSKDGDDIIFSFIFNGGNVGVYKLFENDIGKLISEFSIKNFNSEFIEK